MPPLPADLIQSYVGNGASVLVRRALGQGASDELVERALSFFLMYYREHSLLHTRLYEGVADAIAALKQSGHSLAILTNKPLRISTDIVHALGVKDSFFRIYGGDSFPEKKPDPIGIKALQQEQTCSRESTCCSPESTCCSPESTWMIGDSGVDIQTARNAGVRACGVTWGFQPDAFTLNPPDMLAKTPAEWLHLGSDL